MKKKLLETILHIFHTIYESLENIGIALAKQLITGRSHLFLVQRIVFTSFVITSAAVVGFSETEVTTVQDGPYIHPLNNNTTMGNNSSFNNKTSFNNTTQPINNTCLNCNGTGTINEQYPIEEWVSCDRCSGIGHIQDPIEQTNVSCSRCNGKGGWYEHKMEYRTTKCPVCDGKGYLTA